MAKLFWFDLETTGVNPAKHGIHQIAGRIEIDGVLKEKFDIKLQPNPKAQIDLEALRVASVTLDDIMGYQSFEAGYLQLTTLLGKYVDKYGKHDKFHMAGYNCQSFDSQFLRGLFMQNNDQYFGSWFWPNTIDVFVLAGEHFMNERHLFKEFKLKTVAEYLGIEVKASRLHDADYDIELTKAIYDKLKEAEEDRVLSRIRDEIHRENLDKLEE